MKRWLCQQLDFLDWVDNHPATLPHHADDVRSIIDEAAKRAADAGLPDVVKACQIRRGPVGTDLARRVLSECLAACQQADTLTTDQAAARVNVSPDTVRDWIKGGKLKASNVGKGQQKGRYRIATADLDIFMAARQPEKPAPRKRPKSGPSFQRDFS